MEENKRTVIWVGGLTAVIGLVYAPVLAELVHDWINDPNYSHGFLIPVVSGFLIWNRRKTLSRLDRSPEKLGVLGISLAGSLLVLGVAGAEVFSQRLSFLLLLGSAILFFLGRNWLKNVSFPLAFLLFAIPMPYILYYSLTGPMQTFAAQCAVLGLNVVGVPALRQGNIIHLPQATLEVAQACSGIRSLYAFLALGALLAQSMSIPPWGRFLVFFSTIPLSVVGNAIRVWGSGLGAHLIGPEAIGGTIHEIFGLIVFGIALGFLLLLRAGVRGIWQPAS